MATDPGYREATLNGVTIFGLDPADRAGSTFEAAFDGNLWTFYDYRSGARNPAYVGFDNAEAVIPRAIRFTPRYAYGKRMIGGRFEGSNVSSTEGYEPLYVITENPGDSEQVVELQTTKAYRYFRYYGPAGTYCNIAEFGIEADAVEPAAPVYLEDASVFLATDAGQAVVPVAFQFLSSPGRPGALQGGRLQGSNLGPDSGFKLVHEFTVEPAAPVVELNVDKAYRYYRFVSPPGVRHSIIGFSIQWRLEGTGGELPGADSSVHRAIDLGGVRVFGRDPFTRVGSEFEAVFDGDPATFYEFARSATEDAYVGADIGQAAVPLTILYTSRQGYSWALPGCRFEGSNESPLTGFETLHTITTVPGDQPQRVELNSAKSYRYYRFVAPAGGKGSLAEFNMEIDSPLN